ncbi:unnamed protein product [Penicillium crustosum]
MSETLKKQWKKAKSFAKNRGQQCNNAPDEIVQLSQTQQYKKSNNLPVNGGKYDPPDLWQAAFQQLDVKHKSALMTKWSDPGNGTKSTDATGLDIKIALDKVIDTVKEQYEIGKLKDEKKWLNGAPQKILGAVLALQSNISAIVACDPTGHAASAWAVISLGLSNYRNQQGIWLSSAEYLSDIVSRMILTEISYRGQHAATKDGVENSLSRIYFEILRYSAEIMRIQDRKWPKNLLITAMNDIPLEAERLPIKSGGNAVFDTYEEHPTGECLPGTRTEVLQSLTDWIDNSPGETIFWLEGIAGTGKSTISRSFAKSMQKRGLLAATFFFNSGETDRASLRMFAPTIARQLADAFPVLKKDILDAARFASAAFGIQFDELLSKPLSKLRRTNGQQITQVIVIDALDECKDDNIKSLLQLLPRLNQAESSIDFRIFITSRPENPIHYLLQRIVAKGQTIVLERIDQSTIERDIALFFERKLPAIRDARPDEFLKDDWPGQRNVDILIQMTVPLFISAATIYRQLEYPYSPAELILDDILANRYKSSKLAAIYQPVLNRFLDHPDHSKANLIEEVRLIVGAIVLLEDPLPIDPLAKLIDISRQIVDKTVRSISSVLMVPQRTDEPVRTFHKSFRDFMLDPETDINSTTDKNPFRVDAPAMHRKLASDCVRVMQRAKGGLRKNICRLESYGTPRAQIDHERINFHIPKELQYACRHWVDHLQQSETSISDRDEFHLFLEGNFLPWVEAMVILGYSSEPFKALTTLRSIIRVTSSQFSSLMGYL